jgi:hypothetical protein
MVDYDFTAGPVSIDLTPYRPTTGERLVAIVLEMAYDSMARDVVTSFNVLVGTQDPPPIDASFQHALALVLLSSTTTAVTSVMIDTEVQRSIRPVGSAPPVLLYSSYRQTNERGTGVNNINRLVDGKYDQNLYALFGTGVQWVVRRFPFDQIVRRVILYFYNQDGRSYEFYLQYWDDKNSKWVDAAGSATAPIKSTIANDGSPTVVEIPYPRPDNLVGEGYVGETLVGPNPPTEAIRTTALRLWFLSTTAPDGENRLCEFEVSDKIDVAKIVKEALTQIKAPLVEPPIPSGLTLSTGVEKNELTDSVFVKATWTRVNDASIAGYIVRIRKAPDFDWSYAQVEQPDVGQDPSYTWRGLPANTTFAVQVRSINVYGTRSDWTEEVQIISSKDTIAPATPTGLSVSAAIRSVVATINANTEPDLLEYEWQVALDAGFTNVVNTSRSKSTIFKYDGQPATTYYVRVRAVDTSGNYSGWTAPQQATTGQVITNDIADWAVVAQKIADAAIVTAKIADGAVETTKIADLAVTTAKIADAAIVSAKIGTAAVLEAHIANAAITTAKIADAAVTNAKIANLAVDSAKIADAAIVTAKIADAAITTAKIGDLQVTNAKIASGLDASKITVGTLKVTSSLTIQSDAGGGAGSNTLVLDDAGLRVMESTNYNRRLVLRHNGLYITTDGGVTLNVAISADGIYGNRIVAGSITSDAIFADSVITNRVIASGISANKITTGTLDASIVNVININASNITTGSMNASLITTGTMAADRIGGGTISAGDITVTRNIYVGGPEGYAAIWLDGVNKRIILDDGT